MKVIETTKKEGRKWKVKPKIRKKDKYLSHTYQYEVDGEDLPKKQNKVNKKALLIAISIPLFFFFLINYLGVSLLRVTQAVTANGESILELSEDCFSPINVITFSLGGQMYLLFATIAIAVGIFLYSKFNYKSEEGVVYGQKGDSRLTTIQEIQEQYKEVPEKAKSFSGIGGVPISHYLDRFYIDEDTVNTCILGVSRSGKGEMFITILIDILSRAEQKSSMVVNDPKGELFAGAKDILEQRGYDVQVLNIQEPMQSMSYNPLQLVIDAWLQGNEQEASKMANAISFTLYNDPEAGENAFFNEGAQNAVTAIMLAIVEYCVKNNCPEKITMYNVAEMLNELGTFFYKEDPNDFIEKNALDEFFTHLPQGHIAKKRYGSTSFAGEKTRGSILATANQGLQPFIDPLFAKMTSTNSLELKQIGFPKTLLGQFDHGLINERVLIAFYKKEDIHKKDKEPIGSYKVKIKANGMYALNFDETLSEGDYVLIKYEGAKETYRLIYQLHFEEERDEKGNTVYQKKKGCEHLPDYKREVTLTQKKCTFPVVKQGLKMQYSDKPTAIFMIIPDYDSSNHTLASIFTKQLYTELAKNCQDTKGKKCFNRVSFIMDEFGNMPPIDDMDQIMTVCLGRNILFNIVIQSYAQIKRKYGEAAETIKENCQNHIYIMSTNDDTIEELSKKAGHKTIISTSSNEAYLDIDNKITKSADQERLITPERLGQLLEGETLVIRSLHRQDNRRRKVRPYPIFNTKETSMPYRWQFLSSFIDTSRDLNDIDIKSKHYNLELADLNIDFTDFFVNDDAREKYENTLQYHKPQEGFQRNSLLDSGEEIQLVMAELEGIVNSLQGTLHNADRNMVFKIIQDYKEHQGISNIEIIWYLSTKIKDENLKQEIVRLSKLLSS